MVYCAGFQCGHPGSNPARITSQCCSFFSEKHIKMKTFDLGDHYMKYTLLRVRSVMNLHRDRPTESYVMSSATLC